MDIMSGEEIIAFLSGGSRTAKLATVRADGRPHVAPVWFVVDGDELVFTTGENTVKGRNLQRDPRVSICIDEEEPPHAFVRIDATARIIRDPEPLRHWASEIGARYMGSDRAAEFGRRNGVPGELLVRVPFEHVVAVRGLTD